jgi:hypothetical protein
MLRWLYIQLIRLHPGPFRRQFGDQMLDIFDDAAASLGRQWLLRPEFRRPEAPAAAVEISGVPLFQTIETYRPHPAALMQGGLFAIVSITIAVVLIGKGGGIARPFLIGVHSSKPSLLPLSRDSMTASDLNTTVKLGPDAFEAWLKLARPYFASLAVLRTLDADRDLALSPREIGNSPAALRILDADHDGKLTAEECGLHIDPNSMPAVVLAQLHRRFMSYHPVLAALDADHDGEISAWEIEHAAAALNNLDRDHDGYLNADELLPLELTVHAGLR